MTTPPRIADIYRAAVERGEAPTEAVAVTLGVSRATAGRRVAAARQAGELPPSQPGNSIAHTGQHYPRTARFADASESWLVCAACKVPWPCDLSDR